MSEPAFAIGHKAVEAVLTDQRRGRWHAYRSRLALGDRRQEGFASGGLPPVGDKPILRMLILPSDPEADAIEFDENFWGWWLQEYPDPATESVTQWGSTTKVSHLCALRGTAFGEEEWLRYVALHRCLGLDVGLIGDASYFNSQRQVYVFRLVVAVARIWAALELYARIRERYGADADNGPWELTLALSRTSGSWLGNVASGWQEPGFGFDVRTCNEAGLLRRLEIQPPWPDHEARQRLAYRLGGWIEDCFDSRNRRWIPHPDPGGQPLDRQWALWR